jgi:hypothetical protein
MYSSEIIERKLSMAKKNGLLYKRLPRDRSIEISDQLEKLRYDARGIKLPDGQLTRDLNPDEQKFIASERLLCKCDFEYYATRYHHITRDPGVGTDSGVGPTPLLETQKRVLHLIGKREEVCHAEKAKYGHTAGILTYNHKVRQVAVTDFWRRVTMHRMLFWPGTRCFAASLSDEAIGELYKRDKLAIDNLPFWLQPEVYPDVKNTELGFEHPLGTRIDYRAENEKVGIGTGTQQDVSHLTEVPLWQYLKRVRYSFLPALPKAISTIHAQEGTSVGKGGYWHEVTEGCRNRRAGFEDWTYIFLPWYFNKLKYRKNAPDSWTPNEHTVKHAELIARTSPEFNDGVRVRVTKDQLYWWETERALHAQSGELASFLANYPATPEQSFTNWAQGALPVELIEEMEMDVRPPSPYMLEVDVEAA